MGISDLAFRLLPLGIKIKIGLNAMAETFNKTSDQRVRIEEEQERFLYHIDRCPVCWGRTGENRPVCYISTGLIKESLKWVSGGHEFRVNESECIAMGNDVCRFIIQKEPLS